jgi:hypothetical protein
MARIEVVDSTKSPEKRKFGQLQHGEAFVTSENVRYLKVSDALNWNAFALNTYNVCTFGDYEMVTPRKARIEFLPS